MFHVERMALLADAGADFLACETIPSLPEVRALTRALTTVNEDRARPIYAWLSMSVRDAAMLHDGESTRDATVLCDACPFVFAVGANCAAPGHMSAWLAMASDATDKPKLVYPNSGETWDGHAHDWKGGASTPMEAKGDGGEENEEGGGGDSLQALVTEWRKAGARCGSRWCCRA